MIDKFRAYDKTDGRLLVDGFAILGETTCFGLIEQTLWETPSDKDTLDRLNDVEIVQWTGLVDKKEGEIYEGDMLKDKNGDKWVMQWFEQEGCYVFQNPADKSNFNTLTWLSDSEYIYLSNGKLHDIEIIGNVYQQSKP